MAFLKQIARGVMGVVVSAGMVSCGNAQSAVQAYFAQETMNVEEDAGVLRIPVRLSAPSAKELRVPLRFGGTAEYQRDYDAPALLVIPPNTQDLFLELALKDNGAIGCSKTLRVELEATAEVAAVARRIFMATILDNDQAGKRLRVGAGGTYLTPSGAALTAEAGDVVEIAAGTYDGDVAIWRSNDLLICGMGAGAQLNAKGKVAEGKAIWVIKGDRVRVENIGFSGAKVSDRNAAGIRVEGKDLTVRHCRFTDNENGILAGNQPDSTIVVEHSEFVHNGAGDGRSHNIYIGQVKRLEVRYSSLREALIGHNLKSRARTTLLEYNRIMDGAHGQASYEVDVPNGGLAVLVGNVIQKGPQAENSTLVAYGAEGVQYPDSRLYMVNNTLVNDRSTGTFVQAPSNIPCLLFNNIFAGKANLACALGQQEGNVETPSGGFADRERFDYRLVRGSKAINAHVDPGAAQGFNLIPQFEYFAEGTIKPRTAHGILDAGVHEYIGR